MNITYSDRYEHVEHGSATIYINGAIVMLDDKCKIVEVVETQWGWCKAIIKLSQEKVEEMKVISDEINSYFDSNIPLVYGNTVYARVENMVVGKKIRIKSAYIADSGSDVIASFKVCV